MEFSKEVDQFNLENLKKYKIYLLVIAISMFLISIVINDNVEIKILHFSLIVILFIQNFILNKKELNRIIISIYIYSFTLWGIIRIAYYNERFFTHTPLIGIIMSISFIHLFSYHRRKIYYTLSFFVISLILCLTLENPLQYIAVYSMFLILSYVINKNLYNALIDEFEYKKEILVYKEKLNKRVTSLENDFDELYSAYPKILDFLSHSNLSKFNQEKEFLISTFRLFSNLIIEADYGSLYIIENNKVEFVDAIGHNLDLLTSIYFNSKAFEIGKKDFQIIKDFSSTFKYEYLSKKELLIFKKATFPIKEALMFHVPLSNNIKICIAMDIKEESLLEFSDISLIKIKAFQNIIKTYYQNSELEKLKESLTTDIAMSLTNLLKIHDEYTTDHSEQVATFSLRIGEMMHLRDAELQDLYYASLLHDIGKVIIPNDIINKKDRLTFEEFNILKKHPEIGYEATKNLKNLSSISIYIRHHHERFNGTGYPDQLKGKSIPLISRIITVADAYDAMISERPYREALTKKEAMNELVKYKNTQFDPKIVDIFIDLINS